MSELSKNKWVQQSSEDSDLIHIGPVNEIGVMEYSVVSLHSEDHANLIEAAPDMLEALDNLMYYLETDDMKYLDLNKARAAIAKAKGESK